MNKGAGKNLVLILLLGVAIFSTIRYVSELKARFRLSESLTQSQGERVSLTLEKQNLLQGLEKEKESAAQLTEKNLNLKMYLKASKERMGRLFKDNSSAQKELQDSSALFAILKAENRALINRHQRDYLENEQFKLKLSSVAELKKAIRELRQRRPQPSNLETEGNQGFLFKNGRSTLEKVKIEVLREN